MEGKEHLDRIKRRYFRKAMAFPDGAILHDGDCQIFRTYICTCGLFHEVHSLGASINRCEEFDDFFLRIEEDYRIHELILNHLFEKAEERKYKAVMKLHESSSEEFEEFNSKLNDIFGSSEDYKCLQIFAEKSKTEIWIGDDEGYYVCKGIGRLQERLKPGNYVVSFGLDGKRIPLKLEDNIVYHERDLCGSTDSGCEEH